MYARQTTSEETYTLAEARRIIKEQSKEKRELFISKAKQKFFGLLAISVSIATPILLDGDATASLIMLPLGLYLFITRERVIE